MARRSSQRGAPAAAGTSRARAESAPAGGGLRAVFRPRSIAVIGASRHPGSIGREILHSLIDYDFQGKVFPVNPHADVVHSMKCFASVLEIPDPVDVAVVAVPAPSVREVLEECGRKGVAGVIVITAGFRETGTTGQRAEEELLEICRRHGMRMVGPNCMGIINTDPRVQLDATFAPSHPVSGTVAFLSQSGALGVAILTIARRIRLGISMFASIGNKADVNASDLLEYWATDPRTDIILMYLESFGDPSAFTRLARQVSREKPLVLVKSGRTAEGARAAAGHTGALAGREAAIQALTEQCGLLRVDSIQQLFDVGKALASQPLPTGDRVAVVTNAGGPGIMATDALTARGLRMAELSRTTRSRLRRELPPSVHIANPIDLLAGAGATEYGTALAHVLDDPGVDAAVVIFVPPMMSHPIRVSRRIFREARSRRKPVIGCFMAEEEVLEDVLALKEDQIPIYRFPEATALVLDALRRRQRWLEKPAGVEGSFAADAQRARSVVEEAEVGDDGWLDTEVAFRLLELYEIPSAAPRTIDPHGPLPSSLDYPVVLKATGTGIVHKTEVGGVHTGIESRGELEQARKKMLASLDEHGIAVERARLLVQREIPPGREVIFGINFDSTFGPLLFFGLGGIYVEVLHDAVFRNHPITDRDAREMVRGLRGHALLEGVRGDPPVDFALLETVLLHLDRLAADLPDRIETLEINPFIVHADGGMAVDCRVKLRPRSR